MAEDPSAEQARSAERGQPEVGTAIGSLRRLISRLQRILTPDVPWRRATEFATILVLIVVPVVIALYRGCAAQDPAVDLSCVEPNCVSRKGQITLEAQVSGTVPDDKEILLLHYSVGDVAWFVLSPIVPDDDGKWATTQTLGNPKPHERERRFNTCATLLPLADSNNLKVRMGWIGPHELPSNMVKLDCVSPRRPPGD